MSAFRLPFLAFADQNLSPPVKYKVYILRLLFEIERNQILVAEGLQIVYKSAFNNVIKRLLAQI